MSGSGSQWGDKWGGKWGCPPEVSEYEDLCGLYTWKQLDHATNYLKLCEILVAVFSKVDTKIREMGDRVGLDAAIGDEVDQWGAMVNQPRLGADDELYKRAIKAAARKAYSNGAPHDFFDVAELVNPNVNMTLLEAFPACVRLYLRNLSAIEQRILHVLLAGKPGEGGVQGLAICVDVIEVDPAGDLFEWSYLNDDLSLFPVDHHWDHTDHDIPPTTIAGWAFRL